MADAHKEAHQRISQALIAALLVRPLDSGLTEAELEQVVVAGGISVPVFREVIHEFLARRHEDWSDEVVVSQIDLVLVLARGENHYPADLFPMNAFGQLHLAFDQLDREQGKHAGKTMPMLLSRCSERQEEIECALGVLLVLGRVKRAGTAFVRHADFSGEFERSPQHAAHPWSQAIRNLMPGVERVFAARTGQTVPCVPPIDRFHRFLQKQGWNEFAQWWAMTSGEMDTLSEHHPTATTVLAGALLEAALVAIAELAKNAGQWRNKFLSNPPDTWKLKELIDQAESAGTLSHADAALAANVAELRNRIHAGRHSTAGRGPFRPPSTNSHDSVLAKANLERVLDVILGWPTVLALT
jgi:hypothetical protein